MRPPRRPVHIDPFRRVKNLREKFKMSSVIVMVEKMAVVVKKEVRRRETLSPFRIYYYYLCV